jgi:hypothetical protein
MVAPYWSRLGYILERLHIYVAHSWSFRGLRIGYTVRYRVERYSGC